ncbi:hypothetical protein LIER_40440 [Lithospermum erythrorhizon]|uniref:Uncharacterized protein n=1 Tax=Lithospermum erythrorhizon TaxID=34254 RepID=A0AAV3QXM0_LITER
MATSKKGKFFTLCLILVFGFSHVLGDLLVTKSEPMSENKVSDDNNDVLDVLNKHQVQLVKLEELVKNLSELVSRLESGFLEYHKDGIFSDGKIVNDRIEEDFVYNQKKGDGEMDFGKIGDGALGSGARNGDKVGPVSITRYSPVWSERFHFSSAVKLGTNPTCINVLPVKDYEGVPKYVAVGDDRGRVYLLLRIGYVSQEFSASSESPITVMMSYLTVYKNESILVMGHEDGSVCMHRIWEEPNGEDSSSLHVEEIGKYVVDDVFERSRVTILEVHYVGRKRYILSADDSGNIRVLKEDGTLYGEGKPSSKPLAFLKQRLLFLTDTGAGSLDLRTMKIRTSQCEGLNGTVVKNYIFDATERSKAYGYTSEGALIHTSLLGDIMNFKCRIRSKKKVELDGPISFQSIKGYLLIANHEKVFVYNISQNYIQAGGPRLMFPASFNDIKSSFVNHQPAEFNVERRTLTPLIASDREKLVILNLGSGYVAMYRSNLPLFKNDFNTILWTSPVLFIIIFSFGAYHFFAHKKESLTSWGPDDPFPSTNPTNGAPLGSASGDRSFPDSSRNADAMDLRGNGLRGPPRRYVSPSPYPITSDNPYTGSVDANSRPGPVDPNSRPSSELIFRGSTLETSGFAKRRETLFVNSQGTDDGS